MILRRMLLRLLAVLVLVLGAILGVGWFIAPDDSLRKADAIIVVSGGETERRTDEGIKLWQEGWAPRLVLAGAAADRGTSNAAVMRQRALVAGVPADAITIEEQSKTTIENAERLKPILEARNIKSITVVSSPYHTRRVKATFRKVLGKSISVNVHAAKDSRWARSSWWKHSDTVQLTLDELGKTAYVVVIGR